MGKAENVLHVKLGSGKVMFSGIEREDFAFALGFSEHEVPHKIGEETREYAGKTSDELPTPIRLVISFDNPQCITALVHSLIELQQQMYNTNP